MNFSQAAILAWKLKLDFFQAAPNDGQFTKGKNATLFTRRMHFFVDKATSVPQYLVCKHPTVQFVGLQKSEIGLQSN
jgi:hypothetical protein